MTATATITAEAEAGSEFRAGDRVRAIGAHGFKGTVKAIDPEAGQAWVRWDHARSNVTESFLDVERFAA